MAAGGGLPGAMDNGIAGLRAALDAQLAGTYDPASIFDERIVTAGQLLLPTLKALRFWLSNSGKPLWCSQIGRAHV